MTAPWYATREEVARELDFKEPADRAAQRIDRAIEAASRSIESLSHRRFYPEQATRQFDWPNQQYAAPWRLWLDDNELISIINLSTGGETISPSDFFLRRTDDKDEAPYNLLELSLDSNAAFGGGPTHQRDITITGLWGYTDVDTAVCTLAAGVDADGTSVTVSDESGVGVGSLLRVGTERLIVTGKSMADTGQTLTANVAASKNAETVRVANGDAVRAGEVLLVDAERMLVRDVAGSSLIVTRAWDGTTLAAHVSGAAVFAPRMLAVQRGVLGTTPASHSSGATVYRWEPPGPVRDLCVAEATARLMQGRSGWARTVGTGEGQREASGRGLQQLRDQVYVSHGRKARVRAV